MKKRVLAVLLLLVLIGSGCDNSRAVFSPQEAAEEAAETSGYTLETIPAFQKSPFIPLDDNEPHFAENEKTAVSYERYSELDALGRCGVAQACIGKDRMPTQKRGEIGQIKPTGWQVAKYDEIDGKYLYNRCHLIGFQLAGENANKKNLITGTRYMNVQGMLPFENMVADYVKETGHHVLYRVTPIFKGENLLADGVVMEAESVEDEEIRFHVYCYNVQPGVVIDYKTGENHKEKQSGKEEYIVNTKSRKFHLPACESVQDMSEKNRKTYRGGRENLLAQGYAPCGNCNP